MHETTLLERIDATLPPEFDAALYKRLHPDLARKTDPQLQRHYREYGVREGRRGTPLESSTQFAQLVPGDADALELGPFYKPYLTGERVRYFDVLSRDELVARAERLGFPSARIPAVDFVHPHGVLEDIPQSFDVVLSSHVIEHSPDLIRHLRDVERVLRPGGFYFLLVPDHRYCFDHFLPESSIADVLDAHHSKRRVHSLRSRLEHAALRTHNDSRRHWNGDHGRVSDVAANLATEVEAHARDPQAFEDVHAWYFSPNSFRTIVALLSELSYVRLSLKRLYPTLNGHNEFWAVLQLPRD